MLSRVATCPTFLHHMKLLLCAAALAAGLAAPLPASQTNTAPPLSLAAALQRALERSPALAVYPASQRLADARAVQAAVRPPMELGLDLEDILGTDQYRGFRTSQNTLTLSRVFELGGKRDARGDLASTERERVGAEYVLARASVLAGVADAFIHVVGDQLGLEWSRENVQLAEETLAVAQQRVRAAAAPPLEENRARIALARARVLHEHEEHELETARRRLAAWWGDEAGEFGEAAADLFARPAVPDYDTLVARIARSPELTRWAFEKSVHAAELRLAESRRRPDLTAGLGLRQYAATDDFGMVLQFSLPLGTASRATGLAAEARARNELAEAGERETEIRLRTALFGIAQELRHARTELDAIEMEILPEAERALQLARDGFAAARYPRSDVLDAQRTVLELRRERIEAAIAFHQFVVQLEKILGEPVALPARQETTGSNTSLQ
jgi:cobalt-zinc-cadmium efflux system outer membrane protein